MGSYYEIRLIKLNVYRNKVDQTCHSKLEVQYKSAYPYNMSSARRTKNIIGKKTC